jgi:hypothetical protein
MPRAPATPAAQKAQQQAALNLIIQRTIIADAARKQGLDKDPNFSLLRQRTEDALLVQQFQAKVATNVPPPSAEEVAQFQTANADFFAERKIFDVEQIRMAKPADPEFLKKLQPMKTLDEIASFLTQNQVAFERGASNIDALGQNPNLVKAIVALPPGEVFIISSGNQVLINLIRKARLEPFTGDAATKYALNYLRTQHAQEAVKKQMDALIVSGKASVQIAKDYQPAPQTPGSTPPAASGPVPTAP